MAASEPEAVTSAVAHSAADGHDQGEDSEITTARGKEGDDLVTHLTKRDVLLGRGTGPNEHKGNVYFRSLVREVLEKRQATATHGTRLVAPPPLGAKAKSKLAQEILTQVQSEGGRFLRIKEAKEEESTDGSSGSAKDSISSSSVGRIAGGGRHRFVVVPDAVAVDKIKQSFRHQRRLLTTPPPRDDLSSVKAAPAKPMASGHSQTFPMTTFQQGFNPATVSPDTLVCAALAQSRLSSGMMTAAAVSAPNPTLSALSVASRDLERMKQNLESELMLKVYAARLAQGGGGGGSFPPSTVLTLLGQSGATGTDLSLRQSLFNQQMQVEIARRNSNSTNNGTMPSRADLLSFLVGGTYGTTAIRATGVANSDATAPSTVDKGHNGLLESDLSSYLSLKRAADLVAAVALLRKGHQG